MTPGVEAKAPAWRAPLIVGIVLLLLAALTVADAFRLAASTGPGVGPSVAMKLIGGLLAILGAAHLLDAMRKFGKRMKADPDGSVNPGALAWVLGGLLAQIVALSLGAGFIISSTILFAATARGFGRSIKSRGPIYGLVLSTAVYLFFTQVLSLALPAGPLETLLLGQG